ncbi:MAG: hypothetical protein K0S07_280 [Chlamydiales bacterium]|jgi:hypothetical protein|nr:hypothetical protein [Chlamydiales bacterium]
MAAIVISDETKLLLHAFLEEKRQPELVATYLYYLENQYKIKPVVFPKEKKIYQNVEEIIHKLEYEGKLWRETEIKIRSSNDQAVNDETRKIYICPFTGKVFGDNTHPNPLDAIYDWVSKCSENTEKVGGLKVKRFFVSEDPEVIKSYAQKDRPKETVTRVVYSSVISGKLFSSKQAVIEDFISNYVKPLSLVEVQNQNRFEIEDLFLKFLQEHLQEEKVAAFVEVLSEIEEFQPYVSQWLDEGEPSES